MPMITVTRDQLTAAVDEYIGTASAHMVLRVVARAFEKRAEREDAASGHRVTFNALRLVCERFANALERAEDRAYGATGAASTARAFCESYNVELAKFFPEYVR